MNRRQFISSSAIAALASGCRSLSARTAPGETLRVCVFADLHYCPGAFPNCEDVSFLEKILARAQETHCDMVIHLGDLVHGVRGADEKRLLKLYGDFGIPTYHVLGNHDQDRNPWEETAEAFGLPHGFRAFDFGGFRFIILDPNYFRTADGAFVHYSAGNTYRLPRGARLNCLPPEQIEWFRGVAVGSPHPCVILSHQSLEKRDASGPVTQGADEIRKIVAEANARRPGTVRLVMNGHDHLDYLRMLDGVLYWDVNSANYQYFGKPHNRYPAEYLKTHRSAANCIAWKEPLSAILTLERGGRIRIEGASSDWLFGVSPHSAGLPELYGGRMITAAIQSVDFSMNYSESL